MAAYFAALDPMTLVRALPGNVAQGIIWGIMALGVYITFRILDFADLTVDGSLATGGAVAVMLIRAGVNPALALVFAFLAGMAAGFVTGVLHTFFGIPGILASILTQIGLYSVNLGIMGKSMVRNLMKTGYELHIYARTKAKVDDVISEGAIFHESIKECVPGCDAVITIVGFPRDVEEVYFDEGGILENADPGTYLIDMTTTSPMLAEKISKEGTEKGFHVLDAPVTGGDTGAKNATLSILVGGEKEDYEACMELFKAMGTNINYQGKAGCGQHAKLANQIMIAGALSGVCEAFSYAQAKGLDLNVLFDSVSTGAAGSKQLDVFGPKIIAGDYAPGFFMKHFIKDMKLALTEANMSGLSLEVLSLVLSNYEELAQEGLGDLGTQALIKYYDVQDVEE